MEFLMILDEVMQSIMKEVDEDPENKANITVRFNPGEWNAVNTVLYTVYKSFCNQEDNGLILSKEMDRFVDYLSTAFDKVNNAKEERING